MKIPLSGPEITKKDITAIKKVMASSFISQGPYHERFEKTFSDYIGTKYASVVSSGTAALHLVHLSLGIEKGDEVITTPYSFIASSNSVLFTGAKPVFVDVDPVTFNIDVNKIEEKITNRTKAILAVHVFGMPSDMMAINKIARKYGFRVIEDACEAIGAEISGRKAGTFSDAATFAFYANKQMTTGEGGMIVTDKKYIFDLAQSLKNQGRSPGGDGSDFVRLGYNSRLSEINCALGFSQVERINEIIKKREEKAEYYHAKLKKVDGLELLTEIKGYKRSWFVYVVKLSDRYKESDRNRIMKGLRSKGIGCGRYFPAIHLSPFYKKTFGYKRGDFPVAEKISDRTFAIPFHTKITPKEMSYVCEQLKRLLD